MHVFSRKSYMYLIIMYQHFKHIYAFMEFLSVFIPNKIIIQLFLNIEI